MKRQPSSDAFTKSLMQCLDLLKKPYIKKLWKWRCLMLAFLLKHRKKYTQYSMEKKCSTLIGQTSFAMGKLW